MAKKIVKTKPGFFHNANGMDFEPRIEWSENPDDDHTIEGWAGPFPTFAEAKEDARYCAIEQIDLAESRLKYVNAIKPEPKSKGA